MYLRYTQNVVVKLGAVEWVGGLRRAAWNRLRKEVEYRRRSWGKKVMQDGWFECLKWGSLWGRVVGVAHCF